MKTHYTDSKPATIDSPTYLNDALKLIESAKEVFANFDRRGTEVQSADDEAFGTFIELLYGSGMVMNNFDGPLFDRSLGQLMFSPVAAPVMMSRANLLTIRMFLHTLARGHKATFSGFGYPCFDRAYKSGGLKELFIRLEWLCELAEENGSETLNDGVEIGSDD